MIDWNDQPDRNPSLPSYSILRTPPKGKMSGIIISDAVCGTRLHYWKGRSVPCNAADCDACENGQAPRWKGYLLLKSTQTDKIVIFEFTERGWDPLDEARRKWGTLRGLVLTATRTGGKTNSPLLLMLSDHREDPTGLPAEKDLKTILGRIWEQRAAYDDTTGTAEPAADVSKRDIDKIPLTTENPSTTGQRRPQDSPPLHRLLTNGHVTTASRLQPPDQEPPPWHS